jgi:hypothetical protein
MEAITPILLLGLAGKALLDLILYVRGKDWSAVTTIAGAWIIGIVLTWLFGESSLGAGSVIPGLGLTFGDMNAADVVFVGFLMSGLASGVTEFFKSRDGTRTTAKPDILTGEKKVIVPSGTTIVSDGPPPSV